MTSLLMLIGYLSLHTVMALQNGEPGIRKKVEPLFTIYSAIIIKKK